MKSEVSNSNNVSVSLCVCCVCVYFSLGVRMINRDIVLCVVLCSDTLQRRNFSESFCIKPVMKENTEFSDGGSFYFSSLMYYPLSHCTVLCCEKRDL